MLASEELDDHGRHPTMWTISAVVWVLENPDYRYVLMLGRKIEDPAKEVTMTEYLETVEVPDFERAVAAGHELLDKHATRPASLAWRSTSRHRNCRTRTRNG